jgi:hypothetical protein
VILGDFETQAFGVLVLSSVTAARHHRERERLTPADERGPRPGTALTPA